VSTRALFGHDHVFVRDAEGRRYSDGKLPYGVWQRYLGVFSTLTVVAREREAAPGESMEHLDRACGPRVRFQPMRSLSSLGAMLRRASTRQNAEALVGETDVVIARLPSEIGSALVTAARRRGKTVAVEIVACPWDALWNHGSVAGRLYAGYAAARMRRQVRHAEFVLYVSNGFLQRRYPTRGHAVACSNVAIDRVADEVLVERLRRLDCGSRDVRLGLIGSLGTAYKGIDTAIAALARSSASHPRLRLEVLGSGDPSPWIRLAERNGVADRVSFVGTLPAGRAVHEWLRSVDVYLQPSRQEGLPRALVEAMAQGCPAIGSSAGGIPELLAPECIHRPGSATSLARLVERAVSDVAWRRAQAERNFEHARAYSRERLDVVRSGFWRRVGDSVRHQAGGS
jgi:glycosyltransferase involved in cell wall biosynthesis